MSPSASKPGKTASKRRPRSIPPSNAAAGRGSRTSQPSKGATRRRPLPSNDPKIHRPAPTHPAPLWSWVFGTWFGSGLSPIVPGTAGTAASLPLVWVLGFWLPAWGLWSPWCLAAAALLFYPAVLAAGHVERALGRHDPGAVVVDETLGTLLTMAFLPASAFHHWGAYASAFFLFRLLDVWKPGFIGRSQALPGGWGIVVDDILAGLVGGLVLGLVWWLAFR